MLENFRMAFDGIWSHKLRSALTMLGIIIGIASIIAISSTILGTNEQIKQNLIGSGNNTVVVSLYKGDYEYMLEYEAFPEGISPYGEDTRQQVLEIPEVMDASFYHSRNAYDGIFWGSSRMDGGMLMGVDEHYLSIFGYGVKLGRDFADDDFTGYKKVCLVDDTIQKSLFNNENPVGYTLEIMGEPYTIIGVVKQSSNFEPVINSIEDYYMYMDQSGGKLFVPDSTWPTIYSYDEPNTLVVQARNTEAMTAAGRKAAEILNADVPENEEGIKYKSGSVLDQARELQELANATNSQLIWIASISLLVGGIGVMNIMLVSVTERTREIGLKKALGARRRVISTQFLTEAGVLTCMGGILGVIVGIILAFGVGKVSMVPVSINVPIILAAVLFSFIIGLFFGAFPAVKAARLNPIEALRHE